MIVGNAPGGGANTLMEYDTTQMPPAATLETVAFMRDYRRHVVLLRRLANPYLATGFNAVTNPYITVDAMDYVPAFDAVTRGGTAISDRSPKAAAGITTAGFEPVENTSGGSRRFSVGKVQPYAGLATSTPVLGDVDIIANFPASIICFNRPTRVRRLSMKPSKKLFHPLPYRPFPAGCCPA